MTSAQTTTQVVYEATWRRMSDVEVGDTPAVKSIMQAALVQKIREVAELRLDAEAVQEESDRVTARSFGIAGIDSEESSEFRVAVQAVCDFRTAQAQAREHRMFHTSAPPTLVAASMRESVSAHQSILRHSARSVDEVVCIAQAFGIQGAVRNIIPLAPERLVLHRLTQRFILEFSLQGALSDELVKVMPALLASFLAAHPDFEQQCTGMRTDLQTQALHYLSTKDATGLSASFKESIDLLQAQTAEINAGLAPGDIQQAIAMRVADLAVAEYIKGRVQDYEMARAPALTEYRPLSAQTRATRRIVMMNGGVASGKSSSQALIERQLREEGVEWADVCPLNRDALKAMLLLSEDVPEQYREFLLYLPEDEAYLIRDGILQEYRRRLAEDTAPHLAIDQVVPTFEMMDMAGGMDSKGLDLMIVYTPIENSFRMAYGRGRETGYFTTTQDVLNTHAAVPDQLITNLARARDVGKANIRLTLVANVSKGVVVPIASIDFSTRRGKILDSDRLRMFFRKTRINRQATQFRELYHGTPDPEAFRSKVDELMLGIDREEEGTVA